MFSVQHTWMTPECGVMLANLHFVGELCEKKLPYICEKKDSSNQTESTGGARNDSTTVLHCQKICYLCKIFVFVSLSVDKLVYKVTQCETGWFPWQGFCYNLYGTQLGEKRNYLEAQQVCVENGAQLASIHSLEEMHVLTMHFTGSRHPFYEDHSLMY